MSEREVEDHNRSKMQPPWEPSGGQTEGIVCYLMEMAMLVMMFRTKMMLMMKQHIRVVIEKEPVVHLHHHRRDRRHTVMIGTIVSSRLLPLLATPSSSICNPDFLESAIHVLALFFGHLLMAS